MRLPSWRSPGKSACVCLGGWGRVGSSPVTKAISCTCIVLCRVQGHRTTEQNYRTLPHEALCEISAVSVSV